MWSAGSGMDFREGSLAPGVLCCSLEALGHLPQLRVLTEISQRRPSSHQSGEADLLLLLVLPFLALSPLSFVNL